MSDISAYNARLGRLENEIYTYLKHSNGLPKRKFLADLKEFERRVYSYYDKCEFVSMADDARINKLLDKISSARSLANSNDPEPGED